MQTTEDEIQNIVEEDVAKAEDLPEAVPPNVISDDNTEIIEEEIVTDYDTLVLSGGSSKGIITLGALQYAMDNYLLKKVNTYIGTSAGAMTCYFLAIGYTPIEIMVYICVSQIMEKMLHFNLVAMIHGEGALSFNTIYEHLEKMTIDKLGYIPTFLDLKEKFGKTLVCTTYNFTKEETEYLSYQTHPNLPCIVGLKMSSNLPLLFPKFKYGDSLYIDGGIADNFPIDLAETMGKKVLGLVIASNAKSFSNDADIDVIEYFYKLIFVPIAQITEQKIRNISNKTKVVKLSCDNIKFFNFSFNSTTKLDLFSTGYEVMRSALEA